MKPKSRFQHTIVALSKELPQLSESRQQWAFQNCFEHIGRRTAKGVISCTRCGKSWTDKAATGKSPCPHCGTILNVTDTRARTFAWNEYLGIITTHKGYQVLRYYFISARFRTGVKAEYACNEVVQRWIAPDGRCATLARLRGQHPLYYDLWNLHSPMEIRPDHHAHNIYPIRTAPRQRIIPELTRNGFDGDLCGLHPYTLFHTLLSNPKAETLLKAGQKQLLRYFTTSGHRHIERYWSSIRICIRNGYTVTSPALWCDYVENLAHFGKDTRSAKYLCPENIQAAHDYYLNKRRAKRQKEHLSEQRQTAQAEEEQFRALKSHFFGISFGNDTLRVQVLESAEAHLQEGTNLRHCLYESKYHLRPDSLILSASLTGESIETVEVSTQTMQVVQAFGKCNQRTEYHDSIIALVKQNMGLISSRMGA